MSREAPVAGVPLCLSLWQRSHLRLAVLVDLRVLDVSPVRFFAAAMAAFFARAERSSGVMFFAAVLPPSAPVLRAISAIAALTFAGILMLMA